MLAAHRCASQKLQSEMAGTQVLHQEQQISCAWLQMCAWLETLLYGQLLKMTLHVVMRRVVSWLRQAADIVRFVGHEYITKMNKCTSGFVLLLNITLLCEFAVGCGRLQI